MKKKYDVELVEGEGDHLGVYGDVLELQARSFGQQRRG